MHERAELPEPLRRLVLLQAGAVSREQALAHGLPRRAVDRLLTQRQWTGLGHGVYHASFLAPSWTALVWAGVLIGGDAACAGGAAAAHLHGLLPQPRTITILVPATTRRPVADTRWEFVRTRRPLRSRGAPPRIGVEQAVIDLCADHDLRLDRLVGLLADPVQQRLTTTPRLEHALSGYARHPRRHELREILGDVAVGARSPLERRFLRDVERAHALPTADRQIRRRGTEIDIRYRRQQLLIELDGKLGHAGSGKFRDMRRDNRATEEALASLRYGYADVTGDPCGVAAQVAFVLRLRGWQGEPTICPSCPVQQ